MIGNKINLLPYVDFDLERCLDYTRRVKPGIEALALSATRGDGLQAWYGWIEQQRSTLRATGITA